MTSVSSTRDRRHGTLRSALWHPELVDYVALLTRMVALAVIGAFVLVAQDLSFSLTSGVQSWWLTLLALTATFSWLQFSLAARWSPAVVLTEAVTVFGFVLLAPTDSWPIAIYLLITPVLVGLVSGLTTALTMASIQFLSVVVLAVSGKAIWSAVPDHLLIEFGLLGILFGSAAGAVRGAADRRVNHSSGYTLALSLLEQLSDVTRKLPAGLGMNAVASEAQDRITADFGADEVAIYTPGVDGSWYRRNGDDRSEVCLVSPAWQTALDTGRTQLVTDLPENENNPWTRSGSVRLLPLGADGQRSGMAIVRNGQGWRWSIGRWEETETAQHVGASLTAAEVYADVRERATSEERRRVSREIHDGVAQDLAALAYRLDYLAATSALPEVEQAADEVRRLVRELRYSIFDLRTEVAESQALGTAIGAYAQQVTSTSNIVVHTTVSEHGPALSAAEQHELLRVCQEAVANSRRHSKARNMWITYKNYPTGWTLRVADDGVGQEDATRKVLLNGQGLTIMRERAHRLASTLTVRRRVGGGTVVEVVGTREADRDPGLAQDKKVIDLRDSSRMTAPPISNQGV